MTGGPSPSLQLISVMQDRSCIGLRLNVSRQMSGTGSVSLILVLGLNIDVTIT